MRPIPESKPVVFKWTLASGVMLLNCPHPPCAWWFYAGPVRPCRSFFGRRSLRTGPSSWCTGRCGARLSGSTPRLWAELSRPGTNGSHTFPQRYWEGRGGGKLISVMYVSVAYTIDSTNSCGNITTSLPCKFVLAEDKNFSTDLCHYFAFILWSSVFQHVLNHVVAILILQGAAEGVNADDHRRSAAPFLVLMH